MTLPQLYSGLSRAQLSYEYLHTNSTTHEFLFGALAEIVDNARDANASTLEIFTVLERSCRGGSLLCFLDDGEGMDPSEASNVITFGRSIKKGTDSNQIGQYGNGLKSGSMRIANDLIVFTKKETTMTCLMLSRTFHEEEKIKEVIVPLPSFQVQNLNPIHESGGKGLKRHNVEMDLVLKYSPFKTREEFFSQFRRINGNSGTLVIVYNLKLLDSGVPELDFKTDPHDIVLSGIDLQTDKRLVPERFSFRAYLAILYSEPRMKIYLREKKVQAHRFVYSLFKPRCYNYTSARFKARSKEEAKVAEQQLKIATSKLKETEGRARELEQSLLVATTSRDNRNKLRAAQKAAADLKEEVWKKTMIAEKKQKALKEPKTLTFIFGLNLQNRNCDGLFIYNCNRLIKMYERVGAQLEGGRICRGVVGIINIPYIVLEPTHNKQDFADAKEFRHLLKTVGEHMDHYWRDINIGDVDAFWGEYGYLRKNWEDKPSLDIKYVTKRARQLKTCIQCDACLKWRILPYSASNVGKTFPDTWTCSLNQDTSKNRCSAVEDKPNIPEGKFQKVERTRVEKESELSQMIKRLQEKKNKISSEETVYSSRSVSQSMTRAKKRKEVRARDLVEEPGNEHYARTRHSRPEPTIIKKQSEEAIRSRRKLEEELGLFDSEEEDNEELVDQRESPTIVISSSPSPPKANSPLRIKPNTSRAFPPSPESPKLGDFSQANTSHVSPPSPETPKFQSPPYPQSPESPQFNGPPRKRIRQIDCTDTSTAEECSSWDDDSDGNTEESNKYVMGARVEFKMKNKWFLGTIVSRNGDKIRIKFDKRPSDEYDKRVNIDNPKLKLVPELEDNKVNFAPEVLQHEMPSSSTTFLGSQQHTTEQSLEEITKGYKMCLRFFLPPDWRMDKNMVQNLTTNELINFPLNEFLDSYESGLQQMIMRFQNEAANAQQELETQREEAKRQHDEAERQREDAEGHREEAEKQRADAEEHRARLSRQGELISRLLNSIIPECNLNPETDSSRVEELLEACVEQAELADQASKVD